MVLLPSPWTVLKWPMMAKWLFISVASTSSITSCRYWRGSRVGGHSTTAVQRGKCNSK